MRYAPRFGEVEASSPSSLPDRGGLTSLHTHRNEVSAEYSTRCLLRPIHESENPCKALRPCLNEHESPYEHHEPLNTRFDPYLL